LLRLITKRVFDRLPNLKLVAGHLGEALPFSSFTRPTPLTHITGGPHVPREPPRRLP
jgi:hypothetical protein